MRKSILISISILSVFILCSLSYQPVIADTLKEEIKQLNNSEYNDLLEIKSKFNNNDTEIIDEILINILLKISYFNRDIARKVDDYIESINFNSNPIRYCLAFSFGYPLFIPLIFSLDFFLYISKSSIL